MMKSVVWMMMAVVSMLHAQDLLPELAAPAAQHKAAGEALDKQKLEAITLAAKSYVSALDGVEKAATAKGEIDLVAAVVKEREAVASGTLEPELPAALPKAKLQMARKTLLSSVERISADFAKRKKKADADYLRVLATLQTKAAANPELGKQIAAEKAALLDNGTAGEAGRIANGSGAAKVSRGKNVVVNGDFEQIVDGKPEGWLYTGRESVLMEDGNHFVRFEIKEAKGCRIRKEIDLQKESKTATVAARLRTRDLIGEKGDTYPRCVIVFINEEGKPFSWLCTPKKQADSSWKSIKMDGPVPKSAVTCYVDIETGKSPGQIDFDDVEVTFK